MIDHHERIRIPDENKANDFFADVNWDPKNSKTNQCQFIKFTFPNNQEALVRKEHLLAFLFAIGNPSEQKKMIPQTVNKVRWYETVLSVKANKRIEKGELITFPIKLTMPDEREAVVGKLKTA